MVTKSDLLACSIHNWYPIFSHVTFKTIIIPLPDLVIKWLEEDGIVLPDSTAAFPTRSLQETITAEDDYRDWSSDDEDTETNSNCDSEAKQSLPAAVAAFSVSVGEAIGSLDGAVFPKLTWSSPKDAAWVTVGNTLRCTASDEVLLLLKSSDRVMHDIESALAECEQREENGMEVESENTSVDDIASNDRIPRDAHVVALRKWYDLKPGREFRCFVHDHSLIGISQRDVTRRYSELEDEAASIQERVEDFHTVSIAHKFPLSTYTYDCYVPSSLGAKVKLIDFNPAGGTTAPLLFDWEELELLGKEVKAKRKEEKKVGFRIITEDVAMRPDTAVYGVPYDFVDGSDGSALTALLEQAKKAGAEEVWEALQMAGNGGRSSPVLDTHGADAAGGGSSISGNGGDALK